MFRKTLLAVVLIVFGAALSAGHSWAAAKKKTAQKSDPSPAAVEKVLRAEIAGEVDRRSQLADVLSSQPDVATARWQAGYVRDGKSWRSFDEPPAVPVADLVTKYRLRRDDAADSFAGQVDLANWCKKQGLPDQERAHLTAALALASESDQPALLQRLGYRQVQQQWVSREDFRQWEMILSQTDASLRKWSSKLEKIAARLGETNGRREAALVELHAISDPSVVPAIEYCLAGNDETCALVGVEALRRIPGPEANLALARQAVFSNWPETRTVATAALKRRKLEDFVPPLIALLAVPAEARYRLFYNPAGGVLQFSFVVAVETENQFQLATFNTLSPVVLERLRPTSPGNDRVNNSFIALETQRTLADEQRSLGDRLYLREQQREAANERIKELNGRVISVLAKIADAAPSADARKWWQWWYDYTDAPPAGPKKNVVVVDEVDVAAPFILPVRSHSCFAAGTPVWTETGPVAIDKIRIGDRVLSKDIETGELVYQPVLQTTVNPPRQLLSFRFDDETIVCTAGHRFWASGEGWVKARDLAPQTLLHTVKGNVPVSSPKTESTAETYNLVVADFHTYFVGRAGILCQDLPLPRGTNCVVPGLSRTITLARIANKPVMPPAARP